MQLEGAAVSVQQSCNFVCASPTCELLGLIAWHQCTVVCLRRVGKVVNASCLDGILGNAVRRTVTGQRCFARCSGSSEHLFPDLWDDCELNCFYQTLFGASLALDRRWFAFTPCRSNDLLIICHIGGVNGSTITSEAVPRSLLLSAWKHAFGAGCPALPPQRLIGAAAHDV
jgi:hypothetical protein